MDGAIEGGKKGREIMLSWYESVFGKSSNTFLNSDTQSQPEQYEIIWENIKKGIASIPIIGSGLTDMFNINTN